MTDAHLSFVASMSLNLLWLGPSQRSRNLSLQQPVTQLTPSSSRKHLLPWLPFSASSVDDPSPHLLPPVAPGIRPPASSLPWVHSPHGNPSHRCHRSADDPQIHVMPTPAASMSLWCLQAAQICRAHVNGAHPPLILSLPSASPPQHGGPCLEASPTPLSLSHSSRPVANLPDSASISSRAAWAWLLSWDCCPIS